MNDALARREIWLLLVLLAASAIFYFFVIPKGIADPDGFGIGQGLPPSFTARVTVILIGLILAVRLIQLLVNPAAAAAEPSDPGTAAVSTESGSGLRNVIGIACALAFAFALVPAIGYYLASIAMIAALMRVMGETRWLYIIAQPVAVIGLIWVLFDQVFSIKLPVGWLFGG
ncbi:MAG: tripartite tricarboxylate transporter TctB family protein [Hyphomicrobiaceae bacterium]